MKETRIPFTAESIRAILDGRKTVTRRLVKPQPKHYSEGGWHWEPAHKLFEDGNIDAMLAEMVARCPYGQPGDRLLATETWRISVYDQTLDSVRIRYKADDSVSGWIDLNGGCSNALSSFLTKQGVWRPARYMPTEFSRITLELTSVRGEWLQEIAYDEILLEGWAPGTSEPITDGTAGDDARAWFIALWNGMHPDYPWSSNPMVRRLGLKVLEVK